MVNDFQNSRVEVVSLFDLIWDDLKYCVDLIASDP